MAPRGDVIQPPPVTKPVVRPSGTSTEYACFDGGALKSIAHLREASGLIAKATETREGETIAVARNYAYAPYGNLATETNKGADDAVVDNRCYSPGSSTTNPSNVAAARPSAPTRVQSESFIRPYDTFAPRSPGSGNSSVTVSPFAETFVGCM